MLVHPDRTQLTQMLTLLRQGVKITVASEYTLAEGAGPSGHRAGHVRGKLLLRMSAADGQPG